MRKRRLGSRVGALAFQRIQQPGFLAAHIAPAAEVQIQFEAVTRTEDVLAEISGARRPRRSLCASRSRPACIRRAGKCRRCRPGSHRPRRSTPSISWCGSPSISSRSLKVPGSISSALTTRYLGRGASAPIGTKLHFSPVGKPAPPRPRKLGCLDFLAARSAASSRAAPCAAAW